MSYQGSKEARAAEMRDNPTPGELAALKTLMRFHKAKVPFQHQAVVHGYIVDFLFEDHNVIVEVDGLVHTTPEARIADAERQSHLERKGYRFVRVTNGEAMTDFTILHGRLEAALGVTVDRTIKARLPWYYAELERNRINRAECRFNARERFIELSRRR